VQNVKYKIQRRKKILLKNVQGGKMVNHYGDLNVWQQSFRQCLDVYRATLAFPERERCSLTSKLRRSALLVPSNIAAGCGKKPVQESIEFLQAADRLNCNLEAMLRIAVQLGYLRIEEKEKLKKSVTAVGRMIKVCVAMLERKEFSLGRQNANG
jgi:four helix bundle protein